MRSGVLFSRLAQAQEFDRGEARGFSLFFCGDLMENAVRLQEAACFVTGYPAVERDGDADAVLPEHVELNAVYLLGRFHGGEIVAKDLSAGRRQKIAEPLPDYVFPVVAQQSQPRGIHVKEAPVGIKRLIAQRSVFVRQPKTLFTLLKCLVSPAQLVLRTIHLTLHGFAPVFNCRGVFLGGGAWFCSWGRAAGGDVHFLAAIPANPHRSGTGTAYAQPATDKLRSTTWPFLTPNIRDLTVSRQEHTVPDT